jgi:hypothetical protein
MARTFLTPIDVNQNEIRNFVLHNLASAPSSPVPGQWYFNTATGFSAYWDGDSWVVVGSGGAGGDADTLEGNDSAYHLARANHTGTQAASTISDLAAVVQAYRLDQFASVPRRSRTSWIRPARRTRRPKPTSTRRPKAWR